MSEAWEEITGCQSEVPKGTKAPHPDPSLVTHTKLSLYKHESEETTSLRRAQCLESIFKIYPNAQIDGTKVVVQVLDKKFDFYPASNTYFIHSTQKYGYGIQELCKQIQKKLLTHSS